MASDWIDISVPLTSGMVHWPGDGEVSIERTNDMTRGDDANLTSLNMSAHTGTHMDAPLHFIEDGPAIDQITASVMTGPAKLLHFPDVSAVSADDLARYEIEQNDRLLIKTRNSDRRWYEESFDSDFVHLTTEAAELLAERQVSLVGIDYLSVAGYNRNESEVHQALLGAGVWILEGLDLSKTSAGNYELLCLPLKLAGADGAPARALARPIKNN